MSPHACAHAVRQVCVSRACAWSELACDSLLLFDVGLYERAGMHVGRAHVASACSPLQHGCRHHTSPSPLRFSACRVACCVPKAPTTASEQDLHATLTNTVVPITIVSISQSAMHPTRSLSYVCPPSSFPWHRQSKDNAYVVKKLILPLTQPQAAAGASSGNVSPTASPGASPTPQRGAHMYDHTLLVLYHNNRLLDTYGYGSVMNDTVLAFEEI